MAFIILIFEKKNNIFYLLTLQSFKLSEKRTWKIPSDLVTPKTASRYGHSAVEIKRSVKGDRSHFDPNLVYY